METDEIENDDGDDDNNNNNITTTVVEEDWSHLIDSKFCLSGDAYARHDDVEEFPLYNMTTTTTTTKASSPQCVLKIASVSSLSPIDMVNLSWGIDATGQRVWLGAKLFLHAIPILESYFVDKSIIELGTGTGLSGIAIDKLYKSIKSIILTDASDSALDLCRQNCNTNNVSNKIVVKKFVWGDDIEKSDIVPMSIDTIIATDVLYDINMWKLILQTSNQSLKRNGSLILSHIPRADIPLEERNKNKNCSIESIILEQAKDNGYTVED